MTGGTSVAILDIDGTLVDTNYHHTIAWSRAFAEFEIVLPLWRIHRHIGMGGDQVVPELCGEEVEREHGDRHPCCGGRPLREADRRGPADGWRTGSDRGAQTVGHVVVLASSAKQDEVEHYLDLLDARELTDSWTTSADVEATKPEPDLVHAALNLVDAEPSTAVMIGDTPWDVEAALKAGVETLAVVTGGFAAQELQEAGAADVFESVGELLQRLDETRLGSASS